MRALRNRIAWIGWLFILPSPAWAAVATLVCNGPTPSGSLYDAGDSCAGLSTLPTQELMRHIFSGLICDFQMILNEILSRIYCGIQYAMLPTLAALLTLYVAIIGVQMLYGAVQLNGKEMITHLVKIALVWTFASQASWGVGLAYNFLIGLIESGISWVIAFIVPPGAIPTGWSAQAMFTYVDTMIYNGLSSPFTGTTGQLLSFMAGLFPIGLAAIGGMFVYYFVTVFVIFVRAVLGYLLGLSAISFLIALGPIFVSFALFRSTYNFFESWIKYLISFALQIILVFAVLAIWLYVMSLFGTFFEQLSSVLLPDLSVYWAGPFSSPKDQWGICPYEFVYGWMGPELRCIPDWYFEWYMSDFTNFFYEPIVASAIVKHDKLLYYLFYNVAVLVIVAYAFNALMKQVPHIAHSLAGPSYVPNIGSGGIMFGSFSQTIQQGFSVFSGGAQSAAQAVQAAPATAGKTIDRIGGAVGAFLKQQAALGARRK